MSTHCGEKLDNVHFAVPGLVIHNLHRVQNIIALDRRPEIFFMIVKFVKFTTFIEVTKFAKLITSMKFTNITLLRKLTSFIKVTEFAKFTITIFESLAQ